MVIIEARALGKSFGLRTVFRNVNLRVTAGERVAILGANGCGKSTLLLVLAGVLSADHGTVETHGTIGFAPENPDLPDHLVVAEWLDVVASLKGLRARQPLPFGLDALAGIKLAALSLGQRQRVSLAAAWMGVPSLLLLDEPTNAIDAETREDVLVQLAQRTAVIATHDLPFAQRVATRLVMMRAGAVTE
jgi:ABC-type multidrug transport system ATPase subunit